MRNLSRYLISQAPHFNRLIVKQNSQRQTKLTFTLKAKLRLRSLSCHRDCLNIKVRMEMCTLPSSHWNILQNITPAVKSLKLHFTVVLQSWKAKVRHPGVKVIPTFLEPQNKGARWMRFTKLRLLPAVRHLSNFVCTSQSDACASFFSAVFNLSFKQTVQFSLHLYYSQRWCHMKCRSEEFTSLCFIFCRIVQRSCDEGKRSERYVTSLLGWWIKASVFTIDAHAQHRFMCFYLLRSTDQVT